MAEKETTRLAHCVLNAMLWLSSSHTNLQWSSLITKIVSNGNTIQLHTQTFAQTPRQSNCTPTNRLIASHGPTFCVHNTCSDALTCTRFILVFRIRLWIELSFNNTVISLVRIRVSRWKHTLQQIAYYFPNFNPVVSSDTSCRFELQYGKWKYSESTN